MTAFLYTQDFEENKDKMFAMISFEKVGAITGRNIVNCDSVNISSASKYFELFSQHIGLSFTLNHIKPSVSEFISAVESKSGCLLPLCSHSVNAFSNGLWT